MKVFQISFKKLIFYRTQKTSELHWFSDAGQQSHGACIYLKIIKFKFKAGKISGHLIASNSRLAPIKKATIQKLELFGDLILRRIINPLMPGGNKKVTHT